MSDSGNGTSFLSYLVVFFVWTMVILAGGCDVDKDRFDNVMESEGLDRPTQEVYDWFECGYGDLFSSGFHATNVATDKRVDGTVCCGLLKGCTVRWQ